MAITLPISAIIATRNRTKVLETTLNSLAQQSHQPHTILVADSSDDDSTEALCQSGIVNLESTIRHTRCPERGAAVQRNAVQHLAEQPFVLFLDDDIVFEPECVRRLWIAIDDPHIGGVSAMITNQSYSDPSIWTQWWYRLLDPDDKRPYPGRCLGPAINLLPKNDNSLPVIVPVEWLHSGCTLYRSALLPEPFFPQHFKGYSLFEDVTLSLTVGKGAKLANARTARIYHDSQPGDHKRSLFQITRMEVRNRHFVTTKILQRNGFRDVLGVGLWQVYKLLALAKSPSQWSQVFPLAAGSLAGMNDILTETSQ